MELKNSIKNYILYIIYKMKSYDIKICIDKDDKYKVNDADFINCIKKNAENIKSSNGTIHDAKSKQVNDELTKITNNLLTKEVTNTNRLFEAIYTIFGKIDNDNLEPYIDGQLKNTNGLNTNKYFVFKGGNTIKYWVNRTFLDKMKDKTEQILTDNLEEILSTKITIHENESINACSDFDFSLYIDFKNNKENYKDIVSNIGDKILSLRKEINPIIDDKSLTYFSDSNNTDLFTKLDEYIFEKHGFNTDTENIDFKFITQCKDFILTTINNNDTMYTRDVNDKLIISFNNLIKFNTTDFDLFRIKLGIAAEYKSEYYEDGGETFNSNFKSEIFDLTILRKNDSQLKKFTENISEYTNIIHLKFNNKIIPVRIYNIKYILIDLLEVLFIQSIVPWLNAKYEKRLIRFAYMTSLYNQQIYIADKAAADKAAAAKAAADKANDPSIINNELAFGIFNLLNILNIVNHLEFLDNNINLFKRIINKNLNLNIINKNIIDNDIVVINNIINADFDKSDDVSESYVRDFGGRDDPNKYDNLRNYNKDKYYPNKYFCLIILLFIRKIFVESDEKWYKKIIKNQDADLDFENIKISLKTLLKTYVIHLLITTCSLTNVKELFDEHIQDINLDKFPLNLKGGSEIILKQDEDIILNQDEGITKSKFTYELQKLTEIELINLKFDIINNKLNNNLKKLYEINDYFEDVNHPYLLNYNMEPEIIRKIKDENKIEEVFNILKDILELK